MTWHRLSGKIAGGVAAGTGVIAVIAVLIGWIALLPGLLGTLVVSLLVYGVAHYFLAAPLQRARTALKCIHHQHFDELDLHTPLSHDEMGVLLRRVDHTGHALEEEIEKFRRLENYRRKYIGNVSHELKTPIFTIQGSAETLLNGALEDDDVNRSFVDKIHRNAARLDNLAGDLSEISRIEMGELQMTFEPLSVRSLVDDVIESLESVAERKHVTLHAHLPNDTLHARGDRDRLRQVVKNLVDNAIKYNDEGGKVEVTAQIASHGEAEISVADDGIGVNAEHVQRLTERFYRVDKSRSRSQGGTGLGLAIVKHILGAHDRTLHVESAPGEGSTFSFTLPRTENGAPS